MRKIQCEVCGSTSLKINGDNLFECQNCGVQYSRSELSKLYVEIDHSSEVNNFIKRAERYEASGNNTQAKDYYNRALDLDADNEKALHSIDRINELEMWSRYKVFNAKKDPKANIGKLFEELYNSDTIAYDFFKYAIILSVENKYVVCSAEDYELEYDWSCTGGTIHREWERKYDPILERYKDVLVETTEKYPISGSESKEIRIFFPFLSYSSARYDEKAKEYINTVLLNYTFSLIENEPSYPVQINTQRTSYKEKNYYYDDIKVDFSFDHSFYQQTTEVCFTKTDEDINTKIKRNINSKIIEDYRSYRRAYSKNSMMVLLPIQIVHYMYKGVTYFAISDLVTDIGWQFLFPKDTEWDIKKTEFNRREKNLKGMGGLIKTSIAFATFGVTALMSCFFLFYINDAIFYLKSFHWIFTIPLVGALCFLLGGIKLKATRRKHLFEEKEKFKHEYESERKEYKVETYKYIVDRCIDFRNIFDYTLLSKAQDYIEKKEYMVNVSYGMKSRDSVL
ncbi:MAG: hypothetical protein K6G47_02865 [Clostridia bacterium]|nr:hypothetical protein [Clostridia bacterium]